MTTPYYVMATPYYVIANIPLVSQLLLLSPQTFKYYVVQDDDVIMMYLQWLNTCIHDLADMQYVTQHT